MDDDQTQKNLADAIKLIRAAMAESASTCDRLELIEQITKGYCKDCGSLLGRRRGGTVCWYCYE